MSSVEGLELALSLAEGTIEELRAHLRGLSEENHQLCKKVEFQKAAWTQDHEELASLKQQLAEAQRENEELRKAEILLAVRTEELAALKAQSAEPVAWISEVYQSRYTIELNGQTLPEGTPLYTTPPTATALVDDFKRRAVEVCRKLAEEEGHVGATDCEAAIESLPLIGEK